jgi:2-polyprenyl-6-methoxyphenol hydroxylase-like FAD-dependent oxidoreductase
MKDLNEIDVLIVGAGAAGLTLAIDLARRGVAFRIIEKLDRPFPGSRGKGIQPRTLEIFEDLGVIDQIMTVGSPYPVERQYHTGEGFHDLTETSHVPPSAQEPYGAPLMVPQFQTEAVFRQRLAEFGITPEYGRALTQLDSEDGAVHLRLTSNEGVETLRCRYLVGADGGRSFVRHALEIDFPGKTLGVRAVVADLLLTGLSRDVWHRFNEGDMRNQISFCPLAKTDLFQLQAPIAADGDFDLSQAGLQTFIDTRLPNSGITLKKVAWASAYTMSARLADKYRLGNVFLIGDAAHIHPPTGGQGLNTSVQDAYNLGWKLGAVLAGAHESLLDTYEEERRPIAAAMLGLSTELLEKAKLGDKRRGRDTQQLDLSYANSSLSRDIPDRLNGILAGDRAPDLPLTGASGHTLRLFDLLQGPQWSLVARGANCDVPKAPWPGVRIIRVGAGCAYVDETGALDRIYGTREGDLILIRPDGYVGTVTSSPGGGWTSAYLASIMPPLDRPSDGVTR